MPDGPPPVPVSHFGDADRDRPTVVLREHYPLGRIDRYQRVCPPAEIVSAADDADEAAAAVRDLFASRSRLPGTTTRGGS
jgi:hypothetical protein